MRSNLSPWPISPAEWVVAALAALVALLGTVVIAANELNLGSLVGVGVLSAYGVVSGRVGLRRGYNHRDRFLLLVGELMGCGVILDLVLNLVVI